MLNMLKQYMNVTGTEISMTRRLIGKEFRLQTIYKLDYELRNGYDAVDGYSTKLWTRGDKPKWYNCIPYRFVATDWERNGHRYFAVEPMYRRGTIDHYDVATDAVGIYFGDTLVWFARESIWIEGEFNNPLMQTDLLN